MDALDKLSLMAQIGTVTIDTIPLDDDNQMDVYQYSITVTCNDVEYYCQELTLLDAINRMHNEISQFEF